MVIIRVHTWARIHETRAQETIARSPVGFVLLLLSRCSELVRMTLAGDPSFRGAMSIVPPMRRAAPNVSPVPDDLLSLG